MMSSWRSGTFERVGRALAAASLVAGTTLVLFPTAAGAAVINFNTLGTTSFQVPAGVPTITVDVYGAEGGSTQFSGKNGSCFDEVCPDVNGGPFVVPGGRGGRVTFDLNVAPCETIQVFVGGVGSSAGGTNNGGHAGTGEWGNGAGGGGSSGITRFGNLSFHGGGGGGAGFPVVDYQLPEGGAGGGPVGGLPDGLGGPFPNPGGFFGTPGAAGAGGTTTSDGSDGSTGILEIGGKGGNGEFGGGGGGGGRYGGGGGAGFAFGNHEEGIEGFTENGGYTGGGGGGSSFAPPGAIYQNGVQTGNGKVIISFTDPPAGAPCPGDPPAAVAGIAAGAVRAGARFTG